MKHSPHLCPHSAKKALGSLPLFFNLKLGQIFISNNVHHMSYSLDSITSATNRLSFMSSANVISGLHPDLSVESQCWAGLQGLPLDWPSHLQSPTRLIPNLPTEMSLMWLPPGSSNKCICRSCLPGSQCSLTDPAIFCPGSWAICLTIFSRVTGHLLNNPFQCHV